MKRISKRRVVVAGVGALALSAAAGGVAVGIARSDNSPSPADTAPRAAANFVTVRRQDIVRNDEFDGTLGHGTAAPLVIPIDGTLTRLPKPGDIISPGDDVAEVDGFPVIAATGDVPMWRDLGPGVDDGVDVAQVEAMLAALGYAAEFDVTVDSEWTSATTRAVKAFQEDHGQDHDGTIELGELIFIAQPIRIDSVDGVAGMRTSEAGIKVTGAEQLIQADVGIDDVERFSVGDTLTLDLPGSATIEGTVTAIEATDTGSDGTVTAPVDIAVNGPLDLPDGTPVTVLVGVVSASNVLAVPVEAIVALAEGGYALELRDGASTRYVGVELGAFADGVVEITGEVKEGQEVVVP